MKLPTISSTLVKALAVATGALMLVGTVPAYATVITIDDLAEGIPAFTVTGCTVLNTVDTPEGHDMHCEYIATLPAGGSRLNPGAGTSLSFNISDPGTGTISDTLFIAFTGQAPVEGNLNNISVDLIFRSDTEGVPLPPLTPVVNGFGLIETGGFQSLDPFIDGIIPLSGFSVSFRSDVESPIPEPSTIAILAIGLFGLGFSRRRLKQAELRTVGQVSFSALRYWPFARPGLAGCSTGTWQ